VQTATEPAQESDAMSGITYALSIKQPWAALLVRGQKTIEVRRWPTARRGQILVHAARVSDPRPEVWKLVSEEVRPLAQLVGGIVGAAVLTDCKTYRTREAFADDVAQHLNDASWFQEPAIYGFVFTNPAILPFRAYSGWMRFFPVEES
jgi:hypothetical protein